MNSGTDRRFAYSKPQTTSGGRQSRTCLDIYGLCEFVRRLLTDDPQARGLHTDSSPYLRRRRIVVLDEQGRHPLSIDQHSALLDDRRNVALDLKVVLAVWIAVEADV